MTLTWPLMKYFSIFRYEKRSVVKEEAMDSDLLIPSDKMTMEVIGEIGNSIHPLTQLEVDYLPTTNMERCKF